MVEALLAPLDVARRAAYGALGPFAGRWARVRDVRVLLLGLLAIGTALSTTLAAPFWALALGPILRGVPHVLADVRYLVARPGLHRRRAMLAALPLLAAGLVRGKVVWGIAAAVVVALLGTGSVARKLLAAAVLLPLGIGALVAPRLAELAFAHAHNLVAVLLFVLWRGATSRGAIVVAGGTALVAGGFVAGAFDGPLLAAVPDPAGMPGLRYHLATLAPGAEPTWGLRVVGLFAFMQAMHYALWLRVVPEQARERGPRSFASTHRALVADCGAVVVALAVLAAAAVMAWALVDLGGARTGYLRAAVLHGHVELIACALLLTEGRKTLDPCAG